MGSRTRTGRGTTFGGFAFASLLVAALSGIALALPFDANRAYDSVALLLLTNPGARFYRNVHYFAAQLFLVLTLLHTWDHLRRSTERRLSAGMWARVTLALPLAAFLMLSGFTLKGDAESVQALRIVSTLVGQIPLLGGSLSTVLFGPPSSGLQMLYVHHVATATVLAWLIVAEHARGIWPRVVPTVSVVAVTSLAGLFLAPALHDGLDPLVRGPWYFLGLQEILHWTPWPGLTTMGAALLLLAVLLLPRLAEDRARRVKIVLAACLVLYGGLTAFALLFRGQNWALVPPSFRASGLRLDPAFDVPSIDAMRGRDVPVVLGRREGCLYCHRDTRGLSASHRADAVGCSSCHAGNPFSLDKAAAHRALIAVPGNLSVAARSCGLPQCHPDAVERARRSVMTTMAGVVAVDRAVLGRSEGDDGRSGTGRVHDVRLLGTSPADTHLRQLCASCHLGNVKEEFGPVGEASRGGGCNACHLNYSAEARAALSGYQRDTTTGRGARSPLVHPDVSIDISDDHCFGCHSRSGRISTSYEGWMERAPNAPPVGRAFRPAVPAVGRGFSPAVARSFSSATPVRTLADGRTFDFVAPDVHFEKGMRCVDCHTAREVMGDGVAHARKSEQVRVACEDCHLTGESRAVASDRVDGESRRILAVRQAGSEPSGRRRAPGPFLTLANGGDPLLNTLAAAARPRLIAKQSGNTLDLRRPAAACVQGGGHARLSCVSCHSAWAPRCTGCHTRFDPRGRAYDHLADRETTGAWLEEGKDFEAVPPTLGIRSMRAPDGRARETVETFVPGMVLTVAPTARASDTLFQRLYARAFSHTISKESRSCESCHSDPIAIGYGAGTLKYERVNEAAGRAPATGRWRFTPAAEVSPYDRLPMDAWIGFLEDRPLPTGARRSTRSDVRPFTRDEQKRILTVGACLTCHKGDSPVMRQAIQDVDAVLRRTTSRCVIPVWP